MKKNLRTILVDIVEKVYVELPLVAEEEGEYRSPAALRREIERVKKEMLKPAADLEFERAAELRDRMLMLEKRELTVRG